MSTEPLKTIIDWYLPEEKFRHYTNNLIKQCQEEGKVIALPVLINMGEDFAGQLGLLQTLVDCSKCDGLCCRKEMAHGDQQEGIGLVKSEAYLVVSKGYGHLVKPSSDPSGYFMNYPCPFFSDKVPGKFCKLYGHHPFACLMFPFQPGGWAGDDAKPALAVNSQCPEGRRIAKIVYVNTWKVMQKVREMKGNGFKTS